MGFPKSRHFLFVVFLILGSFLSLSARDRGDKYHSEECQEKCKAHRLAKTEEMECAQKNGTYYVFRHACYRDCEDAKSDATNDACNRNTPWYRTWATRRSKWSNTSCTCGEKVEADGRHGLCCTKSAGRHARHEEINNIICRALQTAKIPAVREPPGLCRDDGKRVDGMTLIPWSGGRTLIWDATCVDTLASSYLEGSSKSAGFACSKAATSKRLKYKELITQNYEFLPFACETLGVWTDDSIKFIDTLGTTLNLITSECKSKLYLKQRISLAIQRGNAASVMGTFPSRSMEEIFYIL